MNIVQVFTMVNKKVDNLKNISWNFVGTTVKVNIYVK
jgi:hypothetical protein